MIIPGFALRHTRTVASCASSSVKSHVSSNKATSSQRSCRPNAPHIQVFVLHSQLGISFRAHFIGISFNGQTHLARDRLRRLGIEHHAIEKPFRNVKKLCHLFSRLHFLSRHKSKGRNLVLWPLSGFIYQLETGLLVHALQLPLHVQRLGVSSSSMETMLASAPSKLSRPASRTSHPSRLSP